MKPHRHSPYIAAHENARQSEIWPHFWPRSSPWWAIMVHSPPLVTQDSSDSSVMTPPPSDSADTCVTTTRLCCDHSRSTMTLLWSHSTPKNAAPLCLSSSWFLPALRAPFALTAAASHGPAQLRNPLGRTGVSTAAGAVGRAVAIAGALQNTRGLRLRFGLVSTAALEVIADCLVQASLICGNTQHQKATLGHHKQHLFQWHPRKRDVTLRRLKCTIMYIMVPVGQHKRYQVVPVPFLVFGFLGSGFMFCVTCLV
jgi:hypothetical protein